MFHFGSPEDTASIYWDKAVGVRGPKVPRRPVDEMSMNQLMNALVYARVAHSLAETDLQPRAVLDVLVAQYDEVFEALADVSPILKDCILENKHKYLGGYDKENIEKYRKLAGIEA